MAFATAHPVKAGFYGFWVGSAALLPGIPFTIPIAYLHYKLDNAVKKKQK